MTEQVSQEVQAAYDRLHATEEFAELRRRYLTFVIPMTAVFMLWYLTYVVSSTFASDFMGTKVIGTINLALVFGLLQFVTTFAIAWTYARYSAAKMDPMAEDLLADFEREVGQ